MKNLKELLVEGISHDTYSDGVDQVENVLDQCIKECGNEKDGIESFITDILGNLEYNVIEVIKNMK